MDRRADDVPRRADVLGDGAAPMREREMHQRPVRRLAAGFVSSAKVTVCHSRCKKVWLSSRTKSAPVLGGECFTGKQIVEYKAFNCTKSI